MSVRDKVRHVAVLEGGRMLKLHMAGIYESDVKEFVEPALATFSEPKRFSEEERKQQQQLDASIGSRKRVQAKNVGNCERADNVTLVLAGIHGQGAHSSKKATKKARRFAREAMKFSRRAQRVAASGLREAQSSSSSEASDDNEK